LISPQVVCLSGGGDGGRWRAQDNVYKRDFKLTAVPTIVKLKEGKEVARLVEGEVNNSTKFEAFFEAG
jgi:hypothetical protein